MADTKTAPVQKPAVEKVEDANTVPADFEIDPKELTQAIRLLRFKIGTLQADARRKAPFLSRSQEEARAKYAAAIHTVVEMADFIDQQKTA
jgi:hypothetical protein